MFNRLVLFLIISLFFITPNLYAYAEDKPAYSITVEDLSNMSDTERNNFMKSYKKIQKAKAEQGVVVINDTVQKGIDMLENVDVKGLSGKAEEIAGAIVIFCGKLGLGVESFMDKMFTSKAGLVILFSIAYKMNMVEAFMDFIVLGIGILFFSWIIFACNTNKIVKLNRYKIVDGKKVVDMVYEVSMPRFSAIFNYFTANKKDDDDEDDDDDITDNDATGIYRIVATVISTAIVLILVVVI